MTVGVSICEHSLLSIRSHDKSRPHWQRLSYPNLIKRVFSDYRSFILSNGQLHINILDIFCWMNQSNLKQQWWQHCSQVVSSWLNIFAESVHVRCSDLFLRTMFEPICKLQILGAIDNFIENIPSFESRLLFFILPRRWEVTAEVVQLAFMCVSIHEDHLSEV